MASWRVAADVYSKNGLWSRDKELLMYKPETVYGIRIGTLMWIAKMPLGMLIDSFWCVQLERVVPS